MKKILPVIMLLSSVAFSAPVLAVDVNGNGVTPAERSEIHQDHKEVKQDRMKRHRAVKNGHTKRAENLQKETKEDRQDLNKARSDARK